MGKKLLYLSSNRPISNRIRYGLRKKYKGSIQASQVNQSSICKEERIGVERPAIDNDADSLTSETSSSSSVHGSVNNLEDENKLEESESLSLHLEEETETGTREERTINDVYGNDPEGISSPTTSNETITASEESKSPKNQLPKETEDPRDRRIRELEEQLIVSQLQNEYLKQIACRAVATPKSTEVVVQNDHTDIGSGVLVPTICINLIKATSLHKPNSFFRKLAMESGVFTLEELCNSSITGRKTNKYNPRPGLDPVKLSAVKNYTISCCGIQPNSVDLFKLEQSIRQLPSTCRKQARRHKNIATTRYSRFR